MVQRRGLTLVTHLCLVLVCVLVRQCAYSFRHRLGNRLSLTHLFSIYHLGGEGLQLSFTPELAKGQLGEVLYVQEAVLILALVVNNLDWRVAAVQSALTKQHHHVLRVFPRGNDSLAGYLGPYILRRGSGVEGGQWSGVGSEPLLGRAALYHGRDTVRE